MAERRMFAKTIIDSDAFLDMPMSTQSLYFHLSMRADDDGFINNPKKIQRMLGASDDDLKILCAKSFIIPFESGVVVIKHWRISNYLRADRYKPTVYQDEMNRLEIKENGSYTKKGDGIPAVYQVVDERETQDRLGKDRLGKDRLGESKPIAAKAATFSHGSYSNIKLKEGEYEKLSKEIPDLSNLIEKMSSYCQANGKRYKDYAAALRNWAAREKKPDVKKEQKSKVLNF